MALVDELKEYRLKNKITLEKLAEILEIKYQTVWRWFKGDNEPNQIQEYAIRKLLGKE